LPQERGAVSAGARRWGVILFEKKAISFTWAQPSGESHARNET
jgi:hypothetical protein